MVGPVIYLFVDWGVFLVWFLTTSMAEGDGENPKYESKHPAQTQRNDIGRPYHGTYPQEDYRQLEQSDRWIDGNFESQTENTESDGGHDNE
ncbi:MAG: hypothetical protein ACYCYO_03855 [Bacilli bacterium]